MASVYSNDFWASEEDLLWLALSSLFVSVLIDGMAEGIEALPPEYQPLVDWDVLNTNALRYAQEYRYDLISKINATTMQQVQEAMTNWINSGDPLSALEDTLAPVFGRVRAEMIAATEITRIFAEANTQAWMSTGFVNKVQWQTSQDERVCPICGPRAGRLYDINGGDKPPAHVRCRCWVTPVVDVDAIGILAEGILNG